MELLLFLPVTSKDIQDSQQWGGWWPKAFYLKKTNEDRMDNCYGNDGKRTKYSTISSYSSVLKILEIHD